ncbi:DUF6308 family protein [Sediminihabitans luteus]|uniref:DUF6308 family protein n=1 Tax=Sediminihabitans luteus TaxID=1138585 RepID=UPI000C23466A|nr:DUF6308 family protein [Sediminihabitans luteus]
MGDHVPEGWPVIERVQLDAAKESTLRALASAPLERYYDVRGGYAGATFASIAPNDPYDVTGADLHALSMLSVTVGPAATRRVLDHGEHRLRLLDALAAVDPGARLEDASAAVLESAWRLHEVAKEALADPTTKGQSDPWVTAAKLVARKRPRLLPVRDTKVRALLGLGLARDGRLELQALRYLVTDPDVTAAMTQAVQRARGQAASEERECVFDVEPLRVLDAALWLDSMARSA